MKVYGTVVALLLFVLTASAQQSPLICFTNAAVPPTIRAEGLTELVGDVVLTCTGGDPRQPFVANFTIYLNTSITSRLLSSGSDESEALLLVDEPVTPIVNTNVFRGKQASSGNSVVWLGVPITPPGLSTRVIRITNIRVNASQLPPPGSESQLIPAQVMMLISISGGASVPLNNPTQVVGFVQTGLTFDVRRCDNTGSANANTLNQCTDQNKDNFNGTYSTVGTSQLALRFTENFPTAFKTRITATQDPSVPGMQYNTESGYVNTAVLGAETGLATGSTRLVARFTNIPNGVKLFAAINNVTGLSLGSATLSATLQAGSDLNGVGGVPATQVLTTNCGVSGTGMAILPVVDGSATAVWEITASRELAVEKAFFPIEVAYLANPAASQPGIGAATVRGGFGPFYASPTGATHSSTLPIARFVDAPMDRIAFTIESTIIVTTAPVGLQITVDGVTAKAPLTFAWTPGSTHTIEVASAQGSGTRYLFVNWSDGGAASHTLTAPNTSTTYTASLATKYLLTTSINPGGGYVVPNPPSSDGYYNAGASVELTASSASNLSFAFFSGDLSGATNPQSVFMNAPRSVTANFSPATGGNVPPYGVELAPFEGAGATQTFTGTFNDANGWTDIAKATFFFHESYAGTYRPCTVEMRPQTGQITVIDDTGLNFLPAVALGSASTVQNSVCSVDAATSNFSGGGNVLVANVRLTFKPAFGSAGGREPRKAVCQWAKDTAGAGEPQSCFGLWIPEAPAPAKIPRFRLYNPANYAHFFTASQHENDVLVGRGFTPEPSPGVVFDQPTSVDGVPTRAYYRILFFPTNGAPIFHYWTRDRDEYKAAIRLRGLNLGEGVDSFMLTGPVPNTFPLSRLLFTAGPSPYPIYHYALEYETSILLGMGWGRSLGIEGYLYPPLAPAAAKAPSARAEKRISAVLSAASHDAGPVAPGQLIRVYGRDFSKLAQAFIDGSAVPLLAVTSTYVELAVPDSVTGKESIELSVDDLGVRTETVTLTVAAARPAVFVKDFLGRGLIETLPSEAGTVTLQVTGAGELELGQPKLPLSVRLNGYPADIISISAIADQPGRLAVNVKVPIEVHVGDMDVATISLQAGEANAQPGLLVRVK